MSRKRDQLRVALDAIQAEEAEQGPPTPQTMILRALNIEPNDRSAADQAFTLGGEFVRITEQILGPRSWTVAVLDGHEVEPGPSPDPMTPGNPPHGTIFAMLLAMRYGREVGRLEGPHD